jgi:hypothetical protein
VESGHQFSTDPRVAGESKFRSMRCTIQNLIRDWRGIPMRSASWSRAATTHAGKSTFTFCGVVSDGVTRSVEKLRCLERSSPASNLASKSAVGFGFGLWILLRGINCSFFYTGRIASDFAKRNAPRFSVNGLCLNLDRDPTPERLCFNKVDACSRSFSDQTRTSRAARLTATSRSSQNKSIEKVLGLFIFLSR